MKCTHYGICGKRPSRIQGHFSFEIGWNTQQFSAMIKRTPPKIRHVYLEVSDCGPRPLTPLLLKVPVTTHLDGVGPMRFGMSSKPQPMLKIEVFSALQTRLWPFKLYLSQNATPH